MRYCWGMTQDNAIDPTITEFLRDPDLRRAIDYFHDGVKSDPTGSDAAERLSDKLTAILAALPKEAIDWEKTMRLLSNFKVEACERTRLSRHIYFSDYDWGWNLTTMYGPLNTMGWTLTSSNSIPAGTVQMHPNDIADCDNYFKCLNPEPS